MTIINEQFEKDIYDFIKKYPYFSIKKYGDISYLKGILDIPNDEGEITGCFSIEIYPTPSYPYAFPKVYEVGYDIPCCADWHKYNDNSCCLTPPANEKIICRNKITLVTFIHEIVIPYFANQLHKKATGKYKQEYSHGIEGIKEFYEDLFMTIDLSIWRQCLHNAFESNKLCRNSECYCNSKKKYKKCHLPVEEKIKAIGLQIIKADFKKMKLI